MSGDRAPLGGEPPGATPLSDDELQGLIPTWVATRADLNVVEAENIVRALPWAKRQARTGGPPRVLDQLFLFRLHRQMFGEVWRWAGTQRRRETNIGVEVHQIASQTRQALGDAAWWHDNEVFSSDELAVRLHHRLVAVHPFPNGNGRCTRLIADLYLVAIGASAFTWGSVGSLDRPSEARSDYLEALRLADLGDYTSLAHFARS